MLLFPDVTRVRETVVLGSDFSSVALGSDFNSHVAKQRYESVLFQDPQCIRKESFTESASRGLFSCGQRAHSTLS